MSIQRLAKLRQYKAKDLKEFTETQFRQSMLAIESAFKDGEPKFFVRGVFATMSVSNNTNEFFEFQDSPLAYDPKNCLINNRTYQAKSTGTYYVSISIPSVLGVDIGTVAFNIYVNDTLAKSATIIGKDTVGQLNVSFSQIIPIDLKVGDEMQFNYSVSGAMGTSSSGAGLIEIQQIIEG